MLQSIRDNSQSIVAKLIVGLIIVTFALFGMESLVSLTSGSNAPATVNGEEISQQELFEATNLQRRQMLAQMGENADPALLDDNLISGLVLNNLIRQKTLLLEAGDKGMGISDNMVDQILVTTPEFQRDGKFSREALELALRNAGFTPLSYREFVKREQLLNQQRAGLMLSAYSLPGEVERIVALDRQTRDLDYFVLPAAELKAAIEIDDASLQQRYEERKAKLLTKESVVLEYLLLNRDGLANEADIEEQQLQDAYQQLQADFQAEERRRASHILIEVNEDQADAVALEKIQAIKARLDAGEDFATVASETSEDFGSSDNGGDLGIQERGSFVESFENALYSLALNQVSEPVKTRYGYHLITPTEIAQSEVPSFEEARAQLLNDAIAAESESLYIDRLEQLKDLAFSSADLAEPSDELSLAIQTSEPVPASGIAASDLFSNAKVLRAAYSPELLEEGLNSDPIELDRGRTIVIRVKEHLQPREQTLEELADLLRAELVDERAARELAGKAEQSLAALNSGEAIASVAGDYSVVEKRKVARADAEVPAELLRKAFAMAHPEGAAVNGQVTLNDGSVAVVSLLQVTPGEVELDEQERLSMSNLLSNQAGQSDYQAFVKYLQDRAEVERL